MKPNRRILRWLVGLVVVMYAVTGLRGVLARLDSVPRPVDGTATELLAGLTIAPETDTGTYDRDRFGLGWATQPNGCDTRTQVLLDETLAPATIQDCTILAGRWHSIYDGVEVTVPDGLDIDHLVPLAEAWASGASNWTGDQRRAFANDLDPARPDALIAVTADANRAKGDADPAQWLPADPSLWCRYATGWITQKAAWDLTVDPAEHQALTHALATCPQGATP